MALNATALFPEIALPLPNVNDDAEHFLFVQRASEALAQGENPFDMWVPQLELGFSQFLYYQHLPHLTVVLVHRLLLGVVELRLVFDAVRYALLLALPLTVYWSMRTIGFSMPAGAVAAAAATLLSGGHRYGFEYDSYVWRGFGLFTQLFGMHLAFLAVATLHRVLERGRGVVLAALVCAALALSHLIYAYMLGITAVVMVLVGARRTTLRRRIGRLALVALPAVAISAYMWLPFVLSSGYLNASPYLDRFKYDSFGAGPILQWLLAGDLLDHGRLPVLTGLLAVGIVATLVTRFRQAVLALVLFLVWLVLYFGRPTLGPLVDLLPMHEGLLLHRFSGAVDLFAIVLMGVGGGWLWHVARAATSPLRVAAVAAALLLLFTPALAERWSYYAENRTWMERTKSALAADRDAASIIDTLRSQPPGRVYAGLNSSWGKTLNFGIPFNSVRFYNLLAYYGFDGVAPVYRGASLNSDLMFDFDEKNLAHYRLFNVEYVVAPRGHAFPAELRPLKEAGRYVLYRAPGGGYAGFENVVRRERPVSRNNLFERMRVWLRGPEPSARRFVVYDYLGSVGERAGEISGCPGEGTVDYQLARPARFDLAVSCASRGTLVLKTTFHPNWRVSVDGVPVPTYMLSPSYIGVDLTAGKHLVTAEYRSSPARDLLLGIGLIALVPLVAYRRRLDALAGRETAPVPEETSTPTFVPRGLGAPISVMIRALGASTVRRLGTWAAAARGAWVGYLACGALVSGVLLLSIVFTPPIAFNDGLGHDGRVYAAMTNAVRSGRPAQIAPPWSYRVAPSAIVAATGLETKTGFRLLDVLAVYGSGFLLFALLRRYRTAVPIALLAVLWWAALPLGLRYAIYYPVLPDSLGFFLLLALVFTAVTGRFALFSVALVAAVLTRENLLALVPFLWLCSLRRGLVLATRDTLLASLPAAIAFVAVHLYPPFPPPPGFENWAERYRIDVNIQFVTSNIDGHAWRFLLAAPLTLGLLVAIPAATFRRAVRFLRAEPAWLYYILATIALAFVGGRDDDRYVYLLVPALAVLTFVAPGSTVSASLSRVAGLTALHLVAVRFLWPVGTTEAAYLQYTIAFMDFDRVVRIAWLVAAVWLATLTIVHHDRILGWLVRARPRADRPEIAR